MEITFFQNTIKNTILAINLSKNQYHKFFEIKDAHIAKITGLSTFSEGNDNYLFSTSHDKLVKLWKFNDKEYSLIGQSKTQKKITKSFFSTNFYFCDKYGDIFVLNPKTPNEIAYHIMGNLATIKVFAKLDFSTRLESYLFISDEYSRIKICRFPEIYDIISVWIPNKGYCSSIVNFNDSLLFLFEFEDSASKLYSLEGSDIENEEFKGKIIDSIKFEEGFRVNIFIIDKERKIFGSIEYDNKGFLIAIFKYNNNGFERIREFKGISEGKLKIKLANNKRILVQEVITNEIKKGEQENVTIYEDTGVKVFCFELEGII